MHKNTNTQQKIELEHPPLDVSDYLIVGSLGSSFGIKGWSKVQSFTEPEENILTYKKLYFLINGKWQTTTIEESKCHGTHILMKLQGCDNPEMAKTYTGTKIAITRDQLVSPKKDEYYWVDLEGCEVFTTKGYLLGRVDYLLDTGANDILVIQGERERLVPFILHRYVTDVDIKNKKITVDWDPEF